MKIKRLYLILIAISIFSCKEDPNQEPNIQEIFEETPGIFTKTRYSSFSKGYDNDVVARLYEEALEKNTALNQLNNKIIKLNKLQRDSSNNYDNFSRNIDDYWSTVKSNYVNEIRDTVLKNSIAEIFKEIESKYKTQLVNHEQKIAEINEKTTSLNDQLILIKLFVTESMMENYLSNEKPTIKTLETIITKYDSLIEETQAYSATIK